MIWDNPDFATLYALAFTIYTIMCLIDKLLFLIIQTPIPDNPDFATLRFHAGPPYEVSTTDSMHLQVSVM